MSKKRSLFTSVVLVCSLYNMGSAQQEIPSREDVKSLLESTNRNERARAKQYLKKHAYDISNGIFEILVDELRNTRRIWTRASISKILGKDQSIDVGVRVPIILDMLEQECANPLSLKPAGYVTESEYLKRQYLFALEKMGLETIPFIQSRLEDSEGEFRDRLLIMLGCLDQKGVYDDLVKILENSDKGFVRSLAARALGKIGDKRAIPPLTRALKDNFRRENITDLIGPEKEFFYPVRSEAYHALRSIGVVVEPLGEHRFRVVE